MHCNMSKVNLWMFYDWLYLITKYCSYPETYTTEMHSQLECRSKRRMWNCIDQLLSLPDGYLKKSRSGCHKSTGVFGKHFEGNILCSESGFTSLHERYKYCKYYFCPENGLSQQWYAFQLGSRDHWNQSILCVLLTKNEWIKSSTPEPTSE